MDGYNKGVCHGGCVVAALSPVLNRFAVGVISRTQKCHVGVPVSMQARLLYLRMNFPRLIQAILSLVTFGVAVVVEMMVDSCYFVISKVMLVCDQQSEGCSIWYHYDCLGLSPSDGQRLGASHENFICPFCIENSTPPRSNLDTIGQDSFFVQDSTD